MTFEQPKHLGVILHQRTVKFIYPFFTIMGLLLSAMLLFGLWLRAQGQHVSWIRWTIGAAIGPFQTALLILMLRYYGARPRYVEFRTSGIYLSERGNIKLRRIAAWTFSPDPINPCFTRLQIRYKFGFGYQRWSMWLDDESQISKLREALMKFVPHASSGEMPKIRM